MKRGLVFAKYGTLAASTRQRFVQATPYLNAAGIVIDIQPLFDNAYLSQLFNSGQRDRHAVLSGYAKRLNALMHSDAYDFLWVHCELFPYLPARVERLVSRAKKPIIYDYDDAIFHQYDNHKNPLVRASLGNKLHSLLQRSSIAFCGNAYLKAYADRHCSRTVILPTTVDILNYTLRPQLIAGDTPILGWIGSPSTWDYCQPLMDTFSSFTDTHKMRVLVVGAGHKAVPRKGFEFRNWSEASEITDIQRMDIGIMPIPDAPWARGKCGYKLIQYMACGIPIIASPVGVNSEIVKHGVNGFLASTENEWREAIATLLGDTALRQRMGQAGRITVEQKYSIQHYGPRMAQWIHEICPRS